jgi:serine/threonine-protein kinase
MYETLTGSPPYVGATVYEIFQKQMNAKPESLAPFIANRNVCRGLESIIWTCLAKDPTKRYQSMAQLQESLEIVMRNSQKTGLFRF